MSGRVGMEKAAGEGEIGRGRGLKRCRSSSSRTSSRSELEDRVRTPCMISYHTNGFGPMLYAVDFDEKSSKDRNFCKKCRIELFKEGNGDLGTEGGKEHNGPPLRRITPLKLGWFPSGKMLVALGSAVYVLGGENEGFLSRDVYYFETANNKRSGGAEADGGWKKGLKMLTPRCRGGALAVEGKIYVFGGNYDLGKESELGKWIRAWGPWGEVYDPIKNEWERLPPPPFNYDDYEEEYVCSELSIAAYGSPSDTKILFSGKATHCAYHVNSGTWE
ncbi:F-box/kelch-repeat protein At1g16250-like isoform X2 [Rhododendron vialii]|nr:F-box/kelch-repeat protein At1g16250-like isoform X2 [Rhododendron vialii]